MCVTALHPKRMDGFWWHFLQMIWQIFARSIFLGFWHFEIDDVSKIKDRLSISTLPPLHGSCARLKYLVLIFTLPSCHGPASPQHDPLHPHPPRLASTFVLPADLLLYSNTGFSEGLYHDDILCSKICYKCFYFWNMKHRYLAQDSNPQPPVNPIRHQLQV